jgi:hypothetical protein
MRRPEGKYWCFTINEPEDYDIPRSWSNVKYCVWQAEVGKSGNEHLQGYVVFWKKLRLSALKKLCYEAHWEQRRGSHGEAKAYCSKADNVIDGPWEIGSDVDVPNGSGARMDVLALKRDLDAGMCMREISDKHPLEFFRYERGIRSYIALHSEHRKFEFGEKPLIFILTGPSGTGKTRFVMECFPEAYWLSKPNGVNGQVWFDGYQGEQVLVVDEFYSWLPFDLLLRLWYFHPLWLPHKGGIVKCGFKLFVFTSNESIGHWYPNVVVNITLNLK